MVDKQVDAFTDSAFKGNPAVVCFLDGENKRDDSWLQSLAAEFNLPMTCFLTPITGSNPLYPPRFILRWFTRLVEMDICAHATLASAHILFSNGLVGSSDIVEFATQSGILIAKKVPEEGSFLVELSLPEILTCEYNSNDVSIFSKALSGATIVDIKGTTTDSTISKALNGVPKAASTDKIIVVLPSWESVKELQPIRDDILKCPGKMLVVTATAPPGSAYDFISRVFGPKIGVDESPVCGSAHCALADYWSLKMNKCDFLVYAASPRSGTVKIHFDKEKQRVLLTGKAVTVMKGSVLALHRSGELKVRYDKEKQRVLLTGKDVTVMTGSVLV
ncbi:hypothetical protein F2Q68_00002432 [Brassica cretica]|uniref:Uncharacterized protein n=1 Tax=Brassica cretica TaxID=69181 RepID=A0A8S9JBE1_BRACR|nr:hypothetical protein F2Q68_00002432 [Brassica cretica]